MKYRSTLFDEARNKIGGIVASKNRNGNYFRDRVIPKNPRTDAQARVRTLFTTLSQAWRSLTDAQRAGWISLAAQVTLHDQLGNVYHPTGQQLYVGNNSNLTNAGLAVIDDAPATPDATPDVSGMIIGASVKVSAPHTHSVNLSLGGGVAGDVLLISATAQYSAGRSFVSRSQYRLLEVEPLPLTGTVELSTLYEPLFGSLVVGSKLSIQVVAITPNGFASQPLTASTVVESIP